MAEITKIQLSPRAELTHVRTEKFKTAVVWCILRTPFTRENASVTALLPRVLPRGTSRLPDLAAIARECDELYGASMSPYAGRDGEVQLSGITSSYIDDDFIPGGGQTERVFALAGEMLLSPAADGGAFVREYVENEKMNLIANIQSIINNKASYAANALNERMFSGEEYGMNALGTVEDAAQITPESLMARYRELLGTACVDIMYSGAASPDKIEHAARTAFAPLLDAKKAEIPSTNVLTEPPSPEVRYFDEEMDVTQGNLVMGFRLGSIMLAPNHHAITLFNAVYGGGLTSKLFKNVREKLSLCYYASSSMDTLKGAMWVTSGIDFDRRDAAEGEILAQLDAMRRGEVSAEELESAKRTVISGEIALLDTPAGHLTLVRVNKMLGLPYTPEEYIALFETVTVDEIVEVANSVKLDSVFFLKGRGAAQ